MKIVVNPHKDQLLIFYILLINVLILMLWFQGTSVLSPLLPIGLTTYLAIYGALKSPSNIFVLSPCLYFLAHGLAGTKVTLKLVVSMWHIHVTAWIYLLLSLMQIPAVSSSTKSNIPSHSVMDK